MESPNIVLSTLPGWGELIKNLHEKLGASKVFSDEDPLIFYHIVKTAGSSFLHAFRLAYPEEAFYDSFNAPTPEGIFIHHYRFATLSEEERTSKKFIHLHVPAPLHQYIPGPSSYATMLRDPTKLVISLYFWQKKLRYSGMADWARYTPEVHYEDLPLEDFLHEHEPIWANMCCKQICNIAPDQRDSREHHASRDSPPRPGNVSSGAGDYPAAFFLCRCRRAVFGQPGSVAYLRGHDRVYLWTPMQASGAWRFPIFIRGSFATFRAVRARTAGCMPGRRGSLTRPSAQ